MNYRTRHMEPKLESYSGFFKTVLVVGARQVGKSSLLAHQFPEMKGFVFDAVQDVHGVRRDPDLFLDNFPPPLILDEIQHVPELLSAIKRRVDRHTGSGQYIMTGSQNLSVLRQVSESLAGRVGILHLDGMTPAEMAGNVQKPGWLEKYLEAPAECWGDVECLDGPTGGTAHFLWRGTLPGLLDADNAIIPGYMHSYVETYVARDVRVIGNIGDLSDFGRFLRLSAALSGREINTAQLGRDIGVNPKTARNWLNTLIHSYQWLELPAYHGDTIKRISRKPKGYLRDTGLICHLMGISTPEALSAHPALGSIFESWAACWIVRLSEQLPSPPILYHWRSDGGGEVDIVLERDGYLYPIEVKCATTLTRHDTRGIRAFRNTYGSDRVKTGIVIYAGQEPRPISDIAIALPWTAL
ncbi:MAG: ATP-binding protein [Lentisphaerae bacterium]|nr:ATP-binding protein [Lentisphaerota bacterium]MBT4814056.1 ATP-binding protein [Lentisphaerota bacterium]MBT5607839.1 ATP-binding protein [Lentisphaerota bacterium]MBT7054821.1 ATP-binding protein [Lentisphaerota bacterium]MBT7845561.1 ATP-binding protein [Lentisphaerota bacterium]